MVRPEPPLVNTLVGKLPVKGSLNPKGSEMIPLLPLGQSSDFLLQQALSRSRLGRHSPGRCAALGTAPGRDAGRGRKLSLELMDSSYGHRVHVEEAGSFAPFISDLPVQPGLN